MHVLDKQLQRKSIEKRYFALVKGAGVLEPEGGDYRPDARDEDSIITRRVAKGGKYAHTSYKVVASYGDCSLGRYSTAYWTNSSDPSTFLSYWFPLVGR